MIATIIPTTPNWDCRCDVARYTKDGLRVATNIFEAAAWHKGIRPVCKCGHSAVFNPHGLWWRFECKGWDDQLVKARERFWCIRCAWRSTKRVRPLRLELVPLSVNDIELPFPPDHEWKRAVSRFRS